MPNPINAHLKTGIFRWGFAVLLISLLIIIYKPALERFSLNDGDHLWYFYELKGDYTFQNAIRHYDYSLSRVTNAGDHLLFRPLFFAWLALLVQLFSYHSLYWNCVNLMLHALVTIALFRLLKLIQLSTIQASLLAMIFAFLTVNWYLVTNNHLSGYLAAFALFYAGLGLAEKIIALGTANTRRETALYAAVLALAVFLNEVILACTLLINFYILWGLLRKRERPSAAFCSALMLPIILYFTWYLVRLPSVPRFWYIDRVDLTAQNLLSAENLKKIIPGALDSILINFKRILAFDSLPIHGFQWKFAAVTIPVLIFLRQGFSFQYLKNNISRLTLYSACLLAYAAILWFVRGETAQVYHIYFFSMIFILIIPAIFDFNRLTGFRKTGAVILLAAWGISHSGATIDRNYRSFDSGAQFYFSHLIDFVESKKDEPGFSFRITAPSKDYDPPIFFQEGYPDVTPGKGRHLHISEVIFMRYYNPQTPAYHLSWSDSNLAFDQVKS